MAIVLTAGVGTWALLHHHMGLGWLSLVSSTVLVVYVGYFADRAEKIHLE